MSCTSEKASQTDDLREFSLLSFHDSTHSTKYHATEAEVNKGIEKQIIKILGAERLKQFKTRPAFKVKYTDKGSYEIYSRQQRPLRDVKEYEKLTRAIKAYVSKAVKG